MNKHTQVKLKDDTIVRLGDYLKDVYSDIDISEIRLIKARIHNYIKKHKMSKIVDTETVDKFKRNPCMGRPGIKIEVSNGNMKTLMTIKEYLHGFAISDDQKKYVIQRLHNFRYNNKVSSDTITKVESEFLQKEIRLAISKPDYTNQEISPATDRAKKAICEIADQRHQKKMLPNYIRNDMLCHLPHSKSIIDKALRSLLDDGVLTRISHGKYKYNTGQSPQNAVEEVSEPENNVIPLERENSNNDLVCCSFMDLRVRLSGCNDLTGVISTNQINVFKPFDIMVEWDDKRLGCTVINMKHLDIILPK